MSTVVGMTGLAVAESGVVPALIARMLPSRARTARRYGGAPGADRLRMEATLFPDASAVTAATYSPNSHNWNTFRNNLLNYMRVVLTSPRNWAAHHSVPDLSGVVTIALYAEARDAHL